MSYSLNCKKCGEEITSDITNPLDLCDDCYLELEQKGE